MAWFCNEGLTTEMVTSYEVTGPMFMNALSTFFTAQCALVGDDVWPVDANVTSEESSPYYDFIVVGAGPAGASLANRLSEVARWNVLLIEAGGNPTLATETPGLAFNNLQTEVDWNYRSMNNSGYCLSFTNGRCPAPRGKVLGGTSSINGLYVVRGNKVDYDNWAALGNDGWSFEDVLPYFRKIENFTGTLTEEEAIYHGTEGYLHIEQGEDAGDYEDLILAAQAELGVKTLYDFNGADQMGAAKTFTVTKDGVRQSSARAYLSPIKDRTNFDVMKNAEVTRVLFDESSTTATGVVAIKNGEEHFIYASKEIILSAGSFNSPKILMQSGIGPRQHLEDLGITVIADLPVGQNLQEHVYFPIFYQHNETVSEESVTVSAISQVLGQYVESGTGSISTTSPGRVVGFMNSTDANGTSPDIQFHHLVFTPESYKLLDFWQKQGADEELVSKFHAINQNNTIIMAVALLLTPTSRGEVLLSSSDPLDEPEIHFNFFNVTSDLETLMIGVKHLMQLGDTEAFTNAGYSLVWLGLDGCSSMESDTDEFIECMIRHHTVNLYHPVGTVTMGPEGDETAVVDPELKVKGINNLRVADASIMPLIVRANTMMAAYMIGEKGADLIKASWQNTKLSCEV